MKIETLDISEDQFEGAVQILLYAACHWRVEYFLKILFKNKNLEYATREFEWFRADPVRWVSGLTFARRRYFLNKARADLIAARRRELLQERKGLDAQLAALST